MRWSTWGARRHLCTLGELLGPAASLVVLVGAGCDEMTRCSTCVDAADDAALVDAPVVDGPLDALPDAGASCRPSGACTDGPSCGDVCCAAGEQCVDGVCRCGDEPACGADERCLAPGPGMPGGCGTICCSGPACPY